MVKLISLIVLMTFVIGSLASCYDFVKGQINNLSGGEQQSHQHSFGDWKTTKEASCTQNGEKVRFCNCGEKETTPITSTGHTYYQGICTICNDSDPDYVDVVYIPSVGLDYTPLSNGAYEVSGIGSCTDDVIVIPSTYNNMPVESIGESAFDNCYNFSKIVIPQSVTSIASSAFICCLGLEEIVVDKNNTVYKSVDGNLYTKDGTTILQYAIAERSCSFIIPDGVITIGEYAFVYCYRLSSITIPESVTFISDNAFLFDTYSRLVEVINHSALDIKAGESTHGAIALYSFEVHSGESNIVQYDDYIFYPFNGTNYLVGYIGKEQSIVLPERYEGERYEINYSAFAFEYDLIDITVPSGVTQIGSSAFEYCENVTNIKLEEGIEYIGDWAFSTCNSITGIDIPKSVVSIGAFAFAHCERLESFVVPNNVTSVGEKMLFNCQSLTNVVIGKGITSIPAFFIYGSMSLTTISISDSVISIGERAFELDPLTDVYYAGSQSQWASINIGWGNPELESATIHYNSKF